MNPILDHCIFTAAFSLILCLAQSKLQMKQPTQLSKSLGYILNDNEAFWEIALEQVDGPKYFKLIKVTFFSRCISREPKFMAHLNVERTELSGYTTFKCFTRVKGNALLSVKN